MGNFIFFVIILFAIAALLRIDFFFTILYLFIGVYLVTHFWSRRVVKNLHLSRNAPERAFLGESLPITLTVENKGHLPIPWLMVNETFSNILSTPPFLRKVITLSGRKRHVIEYILHARRRGFYQIGPLMLETGDLLGIVRRRHSKFKADHLIVYPKILPLSQPRLPTISPQVVLPTPVPLFQDTSRIIGVRGYTHGDNPRHIHWPASASSGQMLVKQFQTAISRENMIFLDMSRDSYGRPGQADIAIELAIVAAASLVNHVITFEELPIGLTTTAFDPTTGQAHRFRVTASKGQAHLMQILEVLARIEAIETDNFLEALRAEAVRLSWGTTIVIITCAESEALLKTALLLKRAGFQVSLVFVQPAAYNYARPVKAKQLGLPSFLITRERDIEAWQPMA